MKQSTINRKLSEAYRLKYAGYPHPYCEGCGGRAIESCHIIAKARCKVLHKVELIWNPNNFFASCRSCHMKWEAIKNPQWLELNNVDKCLEFLRIHDEEGYITRRGYCNN